jgi:hypothetical protein
MNHPPLPEDIRGTWYYLSDEGTPQEALASKGELLTLRLDHSFDRWRIKSNELEHQDDGDYTFDGSFLILRGRNTDTYRVDASDELMWFLEGKKKSRRLFRTLATEDDARALVEDELKSLKVVPSRARCEPVVDDPNCHLVDVLYKDLTLGSIAGERNGNELWAAVTTLAPNIPASTWAGIVKGSYVEKYRDDPKGIYDVTAHMVREGETVAAD